ncbi:MAG: AMP-binding protein [Acidimicrobiales bacterium]
MTPAPSPPTAHVDTFCAERLPPPEQWPELPGIDGYPTLLNAADFLLSAVRGRPFGGSDVDAGAVAYRRGDDVWTYGELDEQVRRLAGSLGSLGLVPGNRVLLRGFNSPELAAAILACLHAGLVAVPTMPLLRAAELDAIATRADVAQVLTDERLADEVAAMDHEAPVSTWGPSGDLDPLAAAAEPVPSVATAATDVALLLFTSGTTGSPKAACHFHRDIAAICDTAGVDIYRLGPDDVVTGTPPLAFAYGFGAFCAFPLRAGASTVLLEQPTPDDLLEAIERHRATVTFTAPTAYRALLPRLDGRDVSSLRYGASAGETLPAPTYEAFLDATGVPLLDGIGSTELLHIFCSNRIDDHRPGLTGTDIAGYRNRVVDDDGNPVPDGEIGHLEVKGPTGCLYLDDERQSVYVRHGWNRTGDLYVRDPDGWFAYQSRADDLIVTSGYNVAGPEVEAALLAHPAVAECAVIGVPDADRGHVVKAVVVPAADAVADAALVAALQDHVKAVIAPYKYPRLVEFRAALPKTGTGKVQRFVLRQQEAAGPAETA